MIEFPVMRSPLQVQRKKSDQCHKLIENLHIRTFQAFIDLRNNLENISKHSEHSLTFTKPQIAQFYFRTSLDLKNNLENSCDITLVRTLEA